MRRRSKGRWGLGGPFDRAVTDYAHNLLSGVEIPMEGLISIRSAELTELLLAVVDTKTVLPELPSEFIRVVRDHQRRTRGRRRAPAAPASPVDDNLDLLAELVGLGDGERTALQFVLALQAAGGLAALTDLFGELSLAGTVDLVSLATGRPKEVVLAALGASSRLVTSGLLSVERERYPLANKFVVRSGLMDVLTLAGLDRRRLLAHFLPEAPPSPIGWADLAHLGEGPSLARDILAAALSTGRPGVNVLLHGPTGTGKTALASLLAESIGTRLLVAGGADEEGESATAHERLKSLMLGQRVVGVGDTLLLFDEFEDLFAWESHGLFARRAVRTSKLWFNDLLEKNRVPTIWITNTVTGIDPALLRRFSYVVEVPVLGARQRARILRRHLGEGALSAQDVERIAERFEASPAQIGTAVATARLLAPTGPDRATLERVLAPVEKILTGTDPAVRPVFDPTTYRVDALNGSVDLVALADRLAGWVPDGRSGLSLCLYGPPGTGKSEYVRFLAHRMGRQVVQKHASDILSKWVGESEQQIAAAFREAEAEDAVLLFDEVDSFLRDRNTALRSWEVSQVNEFLQRLEAFRGVVACTTNLWHQLDPASLRRFVLAIEFRYLGPEQALALFRTVLEPLTGPLGPADVERVRRALAPLRNLTPGDFAVLARRERVLGRRSTPDALVAALAAEVAAKGAPARAVGFRS